ncbi:MAG TPA: hypothetical protein PKE04_21945, partial [Clostridia bacterium]|nr:hypothetical protein [Clostridia bacterium]
IGNVGGDFYLTDASQQFLYGTRSEIPPEALAIRSLSGKTEEVAYVLENGQLVSRVISPSYGLTYTFRIPIAKIIADVDFLFNLIVGVTALFILLGILGATAIVRRWYKPLDALLLGEGSAGAGSVRLAPKEAAQKIRGLFEENRALLSQNQDMRALFEQHRRAQKNQFLRELLLGEADAARLAENLRDYGIVWSAEARFCVAVLSIDEYARFRSALSAMDRSMFDFHLVEKAKQAFSAAACCETAEMDGKETACILAIESGEEDLEQRLLDAATALSGRILAETSISVTVGWSGWMPGVQSIPDCFDHALKARDQRWLSGFGRTYRYGPGRKYPQEPAYPYDLEKEILQALKANDAPEAFRLLERFFQIILESAETNVDMVQHCFLQLLSATYRCLRESYAAYCAGIPPEKELYAEFLAAPTAASSYRKLREFYEFLFGHLRHA